MPKEQLIKKVKALKQQKPHSWFDIACTKFGFDCVLCILGEVNARA